MIQIITLISLPLIVLGLLLDWIIRDSHRTLARKNIEIEDLQQKLARAQKQIDTMRPRSRSNKYRVRIKGDSFEQVVPLMLPSAHIDTIPSTTTLRSAEIIDQQDEVVRIFRVTPVNVRPGDVFHLSFSAGWMVLPDAS